MEKELKVGDTIFWWGDYFDGFNEDGSMKTIYLSGVNKVVKTGILYGSKNEIECFQLDNDKLFSIQFEHKEWELIKPENVEKCTSCGKDTPYNIDTPIELRSYYVEGGGQLCKQCYNKVYGK